MKYFLSNFRMVDVQYFADFKNSDDLENFDDFLGNKKILKLKKKLNPKNQSRPTYLYLFLSSNKNIYNNISV